MARERTTILLVQPRMGFWGHVIRHVPLSLLHAAAGPVQRGLRVELMDLRLLSRRWRPLLRRRLARGDILLVGLSVMSGIPVANAVEVSVLARDEFGVPVVWGGPHPTVAPEEVLEEGAADYVVRGYGSVALADLAEHLLDRGPPLASIKGLSHGRAGELVHNPTAPCFEEVHPSSLPYELLDPNIERYVVSGEDRVFPIYASHGCHGACSFCISTVLYRGFEQHWQPVSASDVLDQIETLRQRWGINYFYFYDDDSLVDPGHLLQILQAAVRRHPTIRFGFRGMRVDRVLALTDQQLRMISRSGGHMLHMGVETGSDRVLRILNKRITVDQTVEVNRRLVAHPGLRAAYNWMLAVPGEQMEDLLQTRDLMVRLVRDNPHCIYFHPNRFIPLPGTRLFARALELGFRRPGSLAQWARLDNEFALSSPWLDEEANRFVDLLQLASYFLDDRAEAVRQMKPGLDLPYRAIRAAYRPLLDLRLRNAWSSHLVEMRLMLATKRAARAWWEAVGR